MNTISMLAILVFIVGMLYIAEQFFRNEHYSKQPEMSDDEFMNQLPEGTSRDVAMRVRTIVSEQMGVPRDRVYPDSKFSEM